MMPGACALHVAKFANCRFADLGGETWFLGFADLGGETWSPRAPQESKIYPIACLADDAPECQEAPPPMDLRKEEREDPHAEPAETRKMDEVEKESRNKAAKEVGRTGFFRSDVQSTFLPIGGGGHAALPPPRAGMGSQASKCRPNTQAAQR